MKRPYFGTPIQRFSRKVRLPADPNGCWLWLGAPTQGKSAGYGKIKGPGRKAIMAHRFSYEAFVGPIPAGKCIDHLCRNRLCVNPAHLEAVTWKENILRGEAPPSENAVKTHCKRGHPLAGENLGQQPSGRLCMTCHRADALNYYYRQKAKRVA